MGYALKEEEEYAELIMLIAPSGGFTHEFIDQLERECAATVAEWDNPENYE